MLDRVRFMETLRSVAEIARVSTTPLSKEEINGYFDSMELTDEQQEMVYEYLLHPQIDEPEQEINEEPEVSTEGQVEEEIQESKFLKMYMEEIQEIPGLSLPEEAEAYRKLLNGDSAVIQRISDHWLTKVVSIAKTYEQYDVNIEDVIQEGNIGLLLGLQSLLGTKQTIDVEEYLKESIEKSIMEYIDEMTQDEDWESTVVAKTTLVHEAKQAMTEQLGREPSIQELCDFTKLSEEEIVDIFQLVEEEKK